MRWFLPVLTAALFVLVGSGEARSCGCCGCCQSSGGAAGCPNCPQRIAAGPAQGGGAPACPNCPAHAASYGGYHYWSSAYGCYLYFDSATRVSYYWSETHRSYYPVQGSPPGSQLPASVGAAPRLSTFSARSTLYYDPDTPNGAALRADAAP